MLRIQFLILSVLLLLTACSNRPAKQSEVPHEVGVAYMNLETGEALVYNAHTIFHAASTMKTPVMFQLYKMRDKGLIDLDDKVPVTNQFKSIVDDSFFSLEISSQQDEILFPHINGYLSYRELMEKMITHSSNLATNILMEYTGADSIGVTMAEIEASGVMVLRGVMDMKAYELRLNNVTTAYGMMKVMEAVYGSDVVADSSRQEMMDILKAQHYNSMIPAGLPDDVVIAHKTGSITRIAHDAAIVFPPDSPPFVLVILTRGWDQHAEASEVGARIAGKLYDYHRGLITRTDMVVPDLIKD